MSVCTDRPVGEKSPTGFFKSKSAYAFKSYKKENQMTDDEIRKQNRETLLSRIAAWGKYDDYEQPIGLLDEAAEEIKRLRAELAAAH